MSRRTLASLRWEAELRRAAERGLLTTAQAAQHMGVTPYFIKHWKTLGLVNDFGGGKGHPSLFDPEELRTAPSRRKNLRLGWRGRPLTMAETMAQRRMNEGKHITLPLDSPFRMLAFSCQCGELVTCKDPRKSQPRRYFGHACSIERERSRQPEQQAVSIAWKSAANTETLGTADRNGYDWTGPELEIIGRQDLTARAAAVMLGRTMYAVNTQRQRLKDDPRKARLAGLADSCSNDR